MTLWEEAVRIRVFGIEMYAFGLYCAIGALCSVLAIAVLCRSGRMKPGTAPLLGVTGILMGFNFARNVFFDNGSVGDLVSAGTISFMSYAVGFKVLTGVGVLALSMLGLLMAEED